jgi:foldase protein PrsA
MRALRSFSKQGFLLLRHTRIAFVLAALALTALVAGCGDSVPSNGVAKVGDTTITKASFNHWLEAAAKQQAQGQPGDADQQAAAVPDPPNFTKCIAAKARQPLPKGAQKPPTSQLKSQCKQAYDGLKQQTMQFLISAEWLEQESKARGVKVTDVQVRKTFEDQKKQAFPKPADYQKFLKTSGRTEEDLLFQVRLSVLTNQLQAKVTESKGKVSQDEISDYYNKNKKRFAQPESRDLLVVLTKKEDKAKEALGELKKGTAWKDVVKKYSVDTASKAQGGKLPGVTKGTQEKAFDAAIFGAKKGETEGPVKTQFGYYVFEVTKITPAAQQTLAQATETIRNLLKSQEQQKALNDFVKDFQKRYRDKTNCAKGFTTTQCKNGPSPSTGQGAQPPAQPQGAPPTSGAGGQQGAPPPSGAPQGAPQQVPPSQGGAPPGAPAPSEPPSG